MSGIRVNEWLHNSGTGGIWQTSAGNVGIASSVPTAKLTVTGDANISGVTTATAFIPTAGQLSHRNLIINGAMNVSQRATTSTSGSAYKTLDRFSWRAGGSGVDYITQAQVALTSADTGPWELGFRNSMKITNGDQSGSSGTANYAYIYYKTESQTIAQSGWNYNSTSSYITLSFWIKASVAQNYYCNIMSDDGTKQNYPFETGTLSANTWTKITKTLPGNANLTLTNDTGQGLSLSIRAFTGADWTDAGVSLNTWAAYNTGTRVPVSASTWWSTDNATLAVTGIQLEVGEKETPFEHRTYQDELLRCQRYYQRCGLQMLWAGRGNGAATFVFGVPLATPLRASPTVTMSGTMKVFEHDASSESTNAPTAGYGYELGAAAIALQQDGHSGLTDDRVINGYIHGTGSYLGLEAEL